MTLLFQLRQGLNHSSPFRTFSSIFSLEIVESAYENKNRGRHIDHNRKGWVGGGGGGGSVLVLVRSRFSKKKTLKKTVDRL